MKDIYAEAKTVAVSIAAVVSFVAAFCFLTAAGGVAFAQGGMRPSPVERRTEILNRQGEQYEIDKSSRDLKGLPKKSDDRRRAHEVAKQIKDDFEGLQESHNQIVLAMAEKEGFSHKLDSIFQAVAEIKKHSTRLKTNLALPKPKQEEARPNEARPNNEQIGATLLTLRKHIFNFVTNPLFDSLDVLDVEQGRTASRDLERIIELSESITKSVDNNKSRPTVRQ